MKKKMSAVLMIMLILNDIESTTTAKGGGLNVASKRGLATKNHGRHFVQFCLRHILGEGQCFRITLLLTQNVICLERYTTFKVSKLVRIYKIKILT